jgi:hypothetical protein
VTRPAPFCERMDGDYQAPILAEPVGGPIPEFDDPGTKDDGSQRHLPASAEDADVLVRPSGPGALAASVRLVWDGCPHGLHDAHDGPCP